MKKRALTVLLNNFHDKHLVLRSDLEKKLTNLKDSKKKVDPMAILIAIGAALQTAETFANKNKDMALHSQLFDIRNAFNEQELVPLRLIDDPEEEMKKLDDFMKRLQNNPSIKLFSADSTIDPVISNEINTALKNISELYQELKKNNKITPRKSNSK